MNRNHTKLPFDPAKIPFFYGWIILVLGITGILLSLPGQTMGVSVFTDDLIKVLRLSRVNLSLAYLIGTVGSAMLLTPAGKLLDRQGARKIGTIVAALFGTVLLLMSFIDRAVGTLWINFSKREFISSFLLIAAAFFLIRFLGQGLLTLISRNMVMKWFDSRRGMANAVLGVFTSFGFSLAPRIFNDMIYKSGWNGAWKSMGVLILTAGALVFWIFSRDNPAECGLEPDGKLKTPELKTTPKSRPLVPFNLRQARKTLPFWVFGLTLGMHALYVTAFTFHVVSIFRGAGMTRTQAVGIFLPASIISVVVNFGTSWLSDYIKLRYIAVVHTASLIFMMFFLSRLDSGINLIMFTIGYGITGGLMNVSNSVVWPRYYGTEHLGEISGMIMGFMVAGSAAGPYFFSLVNQFSGSYESASVICLGITIILFLLSFFVRRPVHPDATVIDIKNDN